MSTRKSRMRRKYIDNSARRLGNFSWVAALIALAIAIFLAMSLWATQMEILEFHLRMATVCGGLALLAWLFRVLAVRVENSFRAGTHASAQEQAKAARKQARQRAAALQQHLVDSGLLADPQASRQPVRPARAAAAEQRFTIPVRYDDEVEDVDVVDVDVDDAAEARV